MGEEELHAAYLRASRAFLNDPSEAALSTILRCYTLYYVARTGSEAGLAPILASIERNARNIMQGLP